MRTILGAMLALLIIGTAAYAQVAPPDARRASRLAALIEWVRRDGRKSTLRKTLDENPARLLGLWHFEDIPVRRKAYQDDTTNIIYEITSLSVNSRETYVLARIIPKESLAWKMDALGTIQAVLESTPSGNSLSNDPHLKALEETISYLENEMRKAAQYTSGFGDAEKPQDFSKCIETNSGDQGISACTRSIESGHYQGHALALLYLSRALKYDHTEHDYARAVADYEQSLALNPQEDAAVKNLFLPEAKQKAATSKK